MSIESWFKTNRSIKFRNEVTEWKEEKKDVQCFGVEIDAIPIVG